MYPMYRDGDGPTRHIPADGLVVPPSLDDRPSRGAARDAAIKTVKVALQAPHERANRPCRRIYLAPAR